MLDGIWQQDCSALWMPLSEALDNYPPERSDRALWLAVGIALGLHAVCFAGLWHLPSPLTWSAETTSTVLTLTLAPPQQATPPREPDAARPVPAAPPRVARTARHAHTPKALPRPQQRAANVPAATQPVMPVAVAATSAAVVAGPSAAETAPIPLTQTLPVYPSTARRRRLQGVVVVAVEVTADGAAQSVVVQRSSGYPVLDSAALDAVRNWRFTPAQRAGQAVSAAVQVPIRFRLTGEQVAGDALPGM